MVRVIAAWCVASCLLCGCASAPRGLAAPAPGDERRVVLHTPEGGTATWEDMLRACDTADVVFLGETHGHPLGLPFEREVWRDVLGRRPGAVLSMEFIDRGQQATLDDYLAGLTTREQYDARMWRSPTECPPEHAEMAEIAKAAGRPVVGANAPRVYVRLARRGGFGALETLTPEQRRLVRAPDELATGRYREEFARAMGSVSGGHVDPSEVDALFRSQQVWDWTMAESIARVLERPEAPVVQVVGSFHVGFEGGLTQALRRLHPGVRVVTIVIIDETSETLRAQDAGMADFVVYVGPGPDRK